MNEHIDTDFCIYCGYPTQCWDHIIPWSWDHDQSWKRKGESWRDEGTVPCCNKCNSLAFDYVPSSFLDKAKYILRRYEKKYRWMATSKPQEITPEEEKELDYKLLTFRKAEYIRHCHIVARVKNLHRLCSGINLPEIHEELLPTVRGGYVRILRTGLRPKNKVGKVLLRVLPKQVDLPKQDPPKKERPIKAAKAAKVRRPIKEKKPSKYIRLPWLQKPGHYITRRKKDTFTCDNPLDE